MERVEFAHPIDVGLFFACGVGTSLCQTAILSCLVYWSDLFGPSSFQFLNLCVFFPLLIVSLFQATFDLRFDSSVGTLRAFTARGCIGFISGMVALGCVVLVDSLVVLCVLSVIVGAASATLFGALNQMAAFLSRCGRLKMGFSFGYQGAGVVVLIMSLSTGFGSTASPEGMDYFFFGCVIIEGICFCMFLVLLFRRENTLQLMYQRDLLNGGGEGVWEGLGNRRGRRLNKSFDGWGGVEFKGSAEKEKERKEKEEKEDEEGGGLKGEEILLVEGGKTGVNYGGEEEEIDEIGGATRGEVLGYWELWKKGKSCCLCAMLTVASSICLASWFSQVQTDSQVLPQILFFTRIFSDTLGRPPTVVFPLTSIKLLGVLCVVRLCVVPVFFLSASASWFPTVGWLLILLVAVLSFSSGFLVTSSYQLAPTTLGRGEEGSLSKLAGLVNVCFSFGCVSGVLLSFLLLAII